MSAIPHRESRSPPEEPTKSEVFHVLRNERRRQVLEHLQRHESPVTVGELAEVIAARESGVGVGEITSKRRKSVYTALQQTHLPTMQEAGIVSYDRDRGTVWPTAHASDVVVYLEVVPKGEFPWREYYLALGAVFSALTAALWVDVYPLTLVPDLGWASLMALVLTASAAAHVVTARPAILGGSDGSPEFSVPAEPPTPPADDGGRHAVDGDYSLSSTEKSGGEDD